MIMSKRITNPDSNKCRIANPTQQSRVGRARDADGFYLLWDLHGDMGFMMILEVNCFPLMLWQIA